MSKIAILIDGGFFIRRMKIIFANGYPTKDKGILDIKDPKIFIGIMVDHIDTILSIFNLIHNEQNKEKLLYRIFFYDAPHYQGSEQYPISKRGINFAKSEQAKFSQIFHEYLKTMPNVALRMGQLKKVRGWVLKEEKQREMLEKLHAGTHIKIEDFSDEDFYTDFRQKAVDMRIGLDIASLVLKKQVDEIVLVTGDSDFLPAAKLARVEGVKFNIDILGQEIPRELLEHVDRILSSFKNPSSNFLPHITWKKV